MLPDRLFYPLALLMIAGLIAGALSLGGRAALTEEQIIAEGWEVSGEALQSLTVSPGSDLLFRAGDTLRADEPAYVTLSQFRAYDDGPASIGVFATLSADYEQAFAGKLLRVTVRARSSGADPLETLHAAYYPMEANSSRWRDFPLTPEWQDHTFFFKPPIIDAPPNVDLMAIFPGWMGERKTMDVASIRVAVEPKPAN